MPNIGDIKQASEIGYEGHAFYLYSSCDICGKVRWVREQDLCKGKSIVCRSCGYRATLHHTRKVESLVLAGARRASEIGKPVFKKRDPWYYSHLCPCCGEPTWHQRKDLHRVCKKCAYITRKTASGADHPNWKGGKYHHGDGYIVVQLLPDSPYYPMAHDRGYVLEHRLLMAQSIGRCLRDDEVVHHINGDKTDNKISNLELLPNGASHLPYIRLQQQVKKLEKKVDDQQTRIKLLEWRIRELEHVNPELAGDNHPRASVETLQEACSRYENSEEKVHPFEKSED